MSQDWSMIPLHIRLTERRKIDPNYPDDDARWWARELGKPSSMHWGYTQSERTTKEQFKLLAYIEEHGPVTVTDIHRDLGIKRSFSTGMLSGLSRRYPIYEEMKDGLYYYQLLPEHYTHEDEMSSLQAGDGPDFEAMHEVRETEQGV